MGRGIYNEGRVVGYSAYEMYVKQHLSTNSETVPATEKEWLSSTIAAGSSILLRVPTVQAADETIHTSVDILLPTNSRLCAANTIIASFFDGDAEFIGESYFASRITDYGDLISNTSESSPEGSLGPTGSVPMKVLADWTESKRNKLVDYMKILDGVIIQPGTWSENASGSPAKDFSPNLAGVPRIRLHVKGSITNSPLILLTGFTNRSVVAGTSGTDTSLHTNSPQDGDFLGPGAFPWAAKIIFTASNIQMAYYQNYIGLETQDLDYTSPGGSRIKALGALTASGTRQTMSLSVRDAQGTQVNLPDNPTRSVYLHSENTQDNLTWAAMLEALSNGKSVDILGKDIKSAKSSLPQNYLTFGLDGSREIRLYISPVKPLSTAEDPIPVGSIGIGWAGDSGTSQETYIYSAPNGRLWGDANGDGVVDDEDRAAVAGYVVNTVSDIDIVVVDFNGDGEVTNTDLLTLMSLLQSKGDNQILAKVISVNNGTTTTSWRWVTRT